MVLAGAVRIACRIRRIDGFRARIIGGERAAARDDVTVPTCAANMDETRRGTAGKQSRRGVPLLQRGRRGLVEGDIAMYSRDGSKDRQAGDPVSTVDAGEGGEADEERLAIGQQSPGFYDEKEKPDCRRYLSIL